MTDTLFNHCASNAGWGGDGHRGVSPDSNIGIRPKAWKSAVDVVREHGAGVSGIEDVIAELEHWQQMSLAKKRQLTEQRFESLLLPVLPKKVVSINFELDGGKGGYGRGNTQNVEVHSLDGPLIATISIDIDRIKDSAWLIAKIADTIGVAKGDSRVITSQGEILE